MPIIPFIPLIASGLSVAGGALANRGRNRGPMSEIPMGASGALGGAGLTPSMEQQLMQLMALQNNRIQRQEPAHQAGVDLAMAMRPNFANRGRVDQAITQAQGPRPTRPQNPQVLQAIQALMAQTQGQGPVR